MDNGGLVSDELILNLVQARINQNDCKKGYLFDGFPRTIVQADGISKSKIYIDYVIEIKVKDDEIIKRMSGRRVHLQSGRTYHIDFNPPKVEGKDDETGEELIQRDDDQENTVRKRLDVYRRETSPLVDYYKTLSNKDNSEVNYLSIDGMKEVKDVTKDIFTKIL